MAASQDNLDALFGRAIDDVVGRLESRQKDLLALYQKRDEALRKANAVELSKLAIEEEELTQRVQEIAEERAKILDAARKAGMRHESLRSIVEQLQVDEDTRKQRLTRLERARKRVSELQRQAWGHWIVARRCESQYAALLDLIENRGRQSATYRMDRPSGGHALIDASA